MQVLHQLVNLAYIQIHLFRYVYMYAYAYICVVFTYAYLVYDGVYVYVHMHNTVFRRFLSLHDKKTVPVTLANLSMMTVNDTGYKRTMTYVHSPKVLI